MSLVCSRGSGIWLCAALLSLGDGVPADAYEYMGKPALDTVVEGSPASFYLGEMLLRFEDGINYDSAINILAAFELHPYVETFMSGTLWAMCDSSRNILALCDTLKNVSGIAVACPNSLAWPASPPSDPYFAPEEELEHCPLDAAWYCEGAGCDYLYWWQWPLHYHDSTLAGDVVSPNAHIRALPAWDISQGDPYTRILIVDGGLAVDSSGVVKHEDLAGSNIHTGRSYNLQLDSLTGDDRNGHGTATTGILAASIGNSIGIAGIASRCTYTVGQIGSVGSMLHAFHHACSLGVSIINCSYFVGKEQVFDSAAARCVEPAIAMLRDSSVLLVASYGNLPSTIALPATFASSGLLPGASAGYENVISVGRLSPAGHSPDQSNETAKVTLVAPGSAFYFPIPSTSAFCDAKYVGYAGTSAAAPHVSGIAALMFSQYGSLDSNEAREILISSADRIWVGVDDTACIGLDTGNCIRVDWHDSLWHPHYGYGRINGFKALNGWHGLVDSCDTAWSTTTLYAGDNRVYIADLSIGDSCSLTVDAGIEVRAITTDVVDGTESSGPEGYPCELVVHGHLIVEGTPDNPVLFSSTNVSGLPAWAGIHVKTGGYLSLKYATIENANVAITLDSGAVVDTIVGCSFVNCGIGIDVRNSSSVMLRNVAMTGVGDYGIHAWDGAAVVRVYDSMSIAGSEDSTTAVAIGPLARLVARNVHIANSWIGFEVRGDGADSIIGCTMDGCKQYAIKLDSGDVADYLADNVIENDAATATNMGIYVNRQSVVSNGDIVAGGYNWAFNFYSANYSNLSAVIVDLHMSGKGADDYGLVLNGPSSSNDVASVTGAVIDSSYEYCHLYMRWLQAQVLQCQFVSTGDSTTASKYGIWDRGGPSTGYVRCTEASDQKTYCVYIDGSSSINYGDANQVGVDDNSFFVRDSSALPNTKYFRYSYSGTKKAEKVWWGQSPPPATRIEGSVDYIPYLIAAGDCNDAPGGGSKLAAAVEVLPDHFELLQNVPNPFNPTTLIEFALPVEQHVKLTIYNILGATVRRFDLGWTSAGVKTVVWNGTDAYGHDVGSGVYFYRLEADDFVDTKKMLFLK